MGAFFSDHESPTIVLEGSGCDFRCGGTAATCQHKEGALVKRARVIIGPLNDCAFVVPDLNHGALINEQTGKGDCLIQKTAPVLSEI
jgi:hypothetical protein